MSRSQAENQSRTLSPPSRQAETACPARVRKRCKMANRSASSSKSLMESRFSSFIVARPLSHLFPQKVLRSFSKKQMATLPFLVCTSAEQKTCFLILVVLSEFPDRGLKTLLELPPHGSENFCELRHKAVNGYICT